MSEAIIAGCIEKNPVGLHFLIKSHKLQSPDSVIVAGTISDINQGRTPVRVLFKRPKSYCKASATVIKDSDSDQRAGKVTNSTKVPQLVKALYGETCQI